MTDILINVPKSHRNYSHLYQYHTNEEYKHRINDKKTKQRNVKQYNHYQKLAEDIEYLKECYIKGMRLRNVPPEFEETIRNNIILIKSNL
jgi:hypothetical protein